MTRAVTEQQSRDEDDGEWISWRDARCRLAASEIVHWKEYPDILGEWAANGYLDTRAKHVFANGKPADDHPIPAIIWRVALGRPAGAQLYAGIIDFSAELPTHGLITFRASGIEVRRSQLEALAPCDCAALLTSKREMEEHERPLAPTSAVVTSIPRGKGGAPKKQDAWDAFWIAVVELAQQERLNIAYFQSQAELRAELLHLIGDTLSESAIKPEVRQVWEKWIKPTT